MNYFLKFLPKFFKNLLKDLFLFLTVVLAKAKGGNKEKKRIMKMSLRLNGLKPEFKDGSITLNTRENFNLTN